jgi:hypothetical protein
MVDAMRKIMMMTVLLGFGGTGGAMGGTVRPGVV